MVEREGRRLGREQMQVKRRNDRGKNKKTGTRRKENGRRDEEKEKHERN